MKPREFWIASKFSSRLPSVWDYKPAGAFSEDLIYVREVLSIPKNDSEINIVHLKQLSEELINKNPNGAMYVSAHIIRELISDNERLKWMIENMDSIEYFWKHRNNPLYFKNPREAIDAAMKAYEEKE